MKKHFLPGLIIFIVLCGIPLYSFAQFGSISGSTALPFGGQVLTKNIPAVSCIAQYGAMVIRPVTLTPPGPYYIMATTKTIQTGSWLLGWYSPIPSLATCSTTSTPPVPVPSFEITSFGVSK